MKSFKISLLLLLGAVAVYGQNSTTDPNSPQHTITETIVQQPAFPGGTGMFGKFIELRLKYPEVATLVGINGVVKVSFTVGKDGIVKNVHALDTIGAGCEEEAVKTIASSPRWTPGVQNNNPIEVTYTVPITFNVPKDALNIDELKKSNYAFIFEIKGTIYTIDETAKILGQSIPQNQVDKVIPYTDKQKYPLAGKKDIYLIKMKS